MTHFHRRRRVGFASQHITLSSSDGSAPPLEGLLALTAFLARLSRGLAYALRERRDARDGQ